MEQKMKLLMDICLTRVAENMALGRLKMMMSKASLCMILKPFFIAGLRCAARQAKPMSANMHSWTSSMRLKLLRKFSTKPSDFTRSSILTLPTDESNDYKLQPIIGFIEEEIPLTIGCCPAIVTKLRYETWMEVMFINTEIEFFRNSRMHKTTPMTTEKARPTLRVVLASLQVYQSQQLASRLFSAVMVRYWLERLQVALSVVYIVSVGESGQSGLNKLFCLTCSCTFLPSMFSLQEALIFISPLYGSQQAFLMSRKPPLNSRMFVRSQLPYTSVCRDTFSENNISLESSTFVIVLSSIDISASRRQTDGDVGVASIHVKDCSIWQLSLQPSPFTILPSSHSTSKLMPSPQISLHRPAMATQTKPRSHNESSTFTQIVEASDGSTQLKGSHAQLPLMRIRCQLVLQVRHSQALGPEHVMQVTEHISQLSACLSQYSLVAHLQTPASRVNPDLQVWQLFRLEHKLQPCKQLQRTH